MYTQSIKRDNFFNQKSIIAISFYEENSDVFIEDLDVASLKKNEDAITIVTCRSNPESYILEGNNVEQIIFIEIPKNTDKVLIDYIKNTNFRTQTISLDRNKILFCIPMFLSAVFLKIKSNYQLEKSHILNITLTISIISIINIMLLEFTSERLIRYIIFKHLL